MALDLQNLVSETQFIESQQEKYVLVDEAARTQLSETIKAIVLQNSNEFNAVVAWYCKCVEQFMGPFAEWQKPTVHASAIAYGNESDTHFRFDIYLGCLWRNVRQIENNPAATRNPISPFGLDTDRSLPIVDEVTRQLLAALASEFLLVPTSRARLGKFGSFGEGSPECVYKPNGDMLVGFSVIYSVADLACVNTRMRGMEGKTPSALYVFSRIFPRVIDGTLKLAVQRVMNIDGSMI
jgi:hypothetical protein